MSKSQKIILKKKKIRYFIPITSSENRNLDLNASTILLGLETGSKKSNNLNRTPFFFCRLEMANKCKKRKGFLFFWVFFFFIFFSRTAIVQRNVIVNASLTLSLILSRISMSDDKYAWKIVKNFSGFSLSFAR